MEAFPSLMFRLHSRWLSLSGAARLTLPMVLLYGGTRCPQSPPPRRHVTCTSSATTQYTCLHFHACGSGFVLARGGCCLCKLYSAQETRGDGGFHHKATVRLHTGKEDKKKKQRTKHRTKHRARFAAALKRRWEGKSLKGRTQSFKVPL